jgi:3-oxoacyl-[acyl-carrier-protein] synthase I
MKAYVNAYESKSCAGDTQELMDAIYSKRTGVTIDTSYMPDAPVGLGKMRYEDFFEAMNEVVGDVLKNSNLDDFKETLLIVGSSVGGMQESERIYFKDKNYKNIDPSRHAIGVIAESLDKKFAFADTRSISTACTSSANAFLLAKRLINVGAYKNVLVVGADALCHTTVCGFYALGVLSSKACAPFNEGREGMNVAEAIAAILVQDQMSNDSIELVGVGASSDAYHMTNPDPEANGAMASMSDALKDASLDASAIDYVNAHGTGTLANDKVEGLAVENLFDGVYVSSTKAITGHVLGAAAAIEAIISCEVIKRGLIPAQANLTEAENKTLNIPRENVAQNVKYVISNSFAFGGNNASLIFGGLSQCPKK